MEIYAYVKIFHIISLIAWMAALFYLPRLFVYHSEYFENKDFKKVIKIQEKKLFNAIAQPAMVATLLSGIILLILEPSMFKSGIWIHIKLLFVFFLVIYHFLCFYYLKKFSFDIQVASGRFFRFFNEIPTIILIIIVACVVLKF